MSMTRTNFKAIAEIIRKYKTGENGHIPELRSFTTELATYFKQANPTFERSRFMRACGWYDE